MLNQFNLSSIESFESKSHFFGKKILRKGVTQDERKGVGRMLKAIGEVEGISKGRKGRKS